MRKAAVCEHEADYAARWAAGAWRGATLETVRGEQYRIVYEGRSGGGAGPDFRDAILARSDGSRVAGDVELHLRAGGWRAHGHERDLRYAGVVLHVVFHPLAPGASPETLLPSGGAAPIVVLPSCAPQGARAPSLPCAGLAQRLPSREVRALLLDAGHARFLERVERLMRDISEAAAMDAGCLGLLWTPAERELWTNLAEALGYGRDRQTLRRAGERLVAGANPDVVRREGAHLTRVERVRLDALLALYVCWAVTGPWEPLRRALGAGSVRAAGEAVTRALHVVASDLSPARVRIVTVNVVLPFAAAYATLEGDVALCERAVAVYDALPGLQSNAITRLMSRQLGLARLPTGACAQQGLHHIWSAWCREKRCEACPCNRA